MPLSFEEAIVGLTLFLALVFVALACVFTYRRRARLKLWVDRLAAYFAPEERPAGRALWPLFLVSFVALYVEIMMIRWIGTEVRIFAFFQNLALIACFLGFGLGCYWSERRKTVLLSLTAMAALVLLVEAPVKLWKVFLSLLSNQLSLSPDAAMWGFRITFSPETALLLFIASSIVVTVFLLLLVLVTVPLGQWVGFYLDRARNPISGYSINLLGSVAGLWLFAGMAFRWLPPEYWFGLAFLLFLLIPPHHRRMTAAGLVLLAGSLVLLRFSGARDAKTYWSPYQKLEVTSLWDRQYKVDVNNSGYMTIADMSPEYRARNPEVAERYSFRSPYDAPFRFAQSCDRVLIVGAGAGNDVAAALRNGARRVDAVEIDPVILSLGERLHPEKPYSSPKVHKILNDARAYLRQTPEHYNVILFGLLDSHTQFSDYSNMRIDNYVYTQEAFRDAKRLLAPGGVVIVKFEVRRPWTWIGQRMFAMLDHVFGRPPISFYAPALSALSSATVFIASDDASLWTRAKQPELAALIAHQPPSFDMDLTSAPPITTDDWPYVYHRTRSIPRTYLTVSLILLSLVVMLVRGTLEPARTSTWHFFFLGAGFLLLETQMICRLALYFGTTWLVNGVALTAILLMLVVANLYVSRFHPERLGPYYVLLVMGLIANYFFPWQQLPFGARTIGVLLSVAYSFPVFFAGVVFTESFRRFQRKSNAFGANIVGAVAGGLAQNLSFMAGMKVLLLIAAVFYVSAGGFGWRAGRQRLSEVP